MRILWFAKQNKTPMSEWVVVHIKDELLSHGIEIDFFNILKYRTPEEANEKLIKYIDNNKGEKCDLFMTDYNERDLFIDTLRRIKEKGIPTLLWCCDNLVVPYRHLNIASHFDLVWLTSKETEWMFKKKGCNTVFLPYAANPYLERTNKSEIHGIGFAGTPYGSRANIINALTENGLDVYCYYKKNDEYYNDGENEDIIYRREFQEKGFYVFRKMLGYKEGRKIIEGAIANKLKPSSRINLGSEFFHPEYMVSPKDVYKVYGACALSLSSTTARNTGVLDKPLFIVNLRSFEIPMAGGIQFCRYNPELSEYFENGKEIVFFSDNDDMVDKARFYLDPKQEELRKQIKVKARARAEGEHTWFHRFKKVFVELGITCPGMDDKT